MWRNSRWIVVMWLCWAFFIILNQSLCFTVLTQTVTIFNYQTSRLLASLGRNSHTAHAVKLCCLLHPSRCWLISFSHSPTVTYGGSSYRLDKDVTSWHQGWDRQLTVCSHATNCSGGGITVINYINVRVKIDILMWDDSFQELMGN